jgi:type IV pilus assembly protein PilX
MNPNHHSRRQRGATLIIALISLVILSISALAMMRSTSTSLFMAGNLAFKRDVANQAERAIAAAITDMATGSLTSDSTRLNNSTARNYSATTLATSTEGIPSVLLSDTAFAAAGFTNARDIVDAPSSVTVRYVIDRQCTAAGAFDASGCQTIIPSPPKSGGGTNDPNGNPGADRRPAYRISVRITGPRGIQTFVQTTAVL